MAATQYIPLCACGNPLKVFALSGRTQIMCRACTMKRTPTPTTCQECGVVLNKTNNHQKFCSYTCCQAYHARKRRKWPQGAPTRKIARICKGCGKTFTPKSNRYGTYCTRECAWTHKVGDRHPQYVEKAPPFSRIWFRNCARCGVSFVARTRQRAQCVPRCVGIAVSNECKGCGKTFVRPAGRDGRPRLFCDDRCTRRFAKREHARRYGKSYRKKARRLGVTYEPVNRMMVFERDGWRCAICGKRTPRERKGTLYSNAPELDHRIPFALGGSHTYENTQCACRSCNQYKGGHTVLGQISIAYQ